METASRSEVIKFSAGGFRDFTRIAASDPEMWRDVFLNNKEATLEILGRFTEELFALQRAIRTGDGDHLFDYLPIRGMSDAALLRPGKIQTPLTLGVGRKSRDPADGHRPDFARGHYGSGQCACVFTAPSCQRRCVSPRLAQLCARKIAAPQGAVKFG